MTLALISSYGQIVATRDPDIKMKDANMKRSESRFASDWLAGEQVSSTPVSYVCLSPAFSPPPIFLLQTSLSLSLFLRVLRLKIPRLSFQYSPLPPPQPPLARGTYAPVMFCDPTVDRSAVHPGAVFNLCTGAHLMCCREA